MAALNESSSWPPPVYTVSDEPTYKFLAPEDEGEVATEPIVESFADLENGRRGTFWGSVFNLVNSAIGAGMLSLPYALQCSGLVLGMMILLMSTVVTGYGSVLLGRAASNADVSAKSYETMIGAILGSRARLLAQICIICNQFGGCVAMFIIIGDLSPPVIQQYITENDFLSGRFFITLLAAIIVVAPLAFMRTFAALSNFSSIAFVCIIYVVIAVTIRSAQYLNDNGGVNEGIDLAYLRFDIFKSITICSYALGCSVQCPPVYYELKEEIRSISNFLKIVGAAYCEIVIIYSAIGVMAYINYGTDVDGNVLTNYPDDDVLINVSRVAMSVLAALSYPLISWTFRSSMESTFFYNRPPSNFRYYSITIAILVLSFALSQAFPQIVVVFSLMGATFATVLNYIFPAACAAKLAVREGLQHWSIMLGPLFIFVFGIFFGVMGTVVTIASLI